MAATGYLTVRTYASRAQLPIANATVVVNENTDDGTRLLAIRITDQSGRISPIPITTPDRADSLSPGDPRPWTPVELIVEHPDYERVLVENLQVFAGVNSQQDIELLPLNELPDAYNTTEVIDITAQPL